MLQPDPVHRGRVIALLILLAIAGGFAIYSHTVLPKEVEKSIKHLQYRKMLSNGR